VKRAAAEFALPSDAVTVCKPVAAAGTVNEQELKLPFSSATQDVATLRPSKRTAMVLYGAKPLPLTPAVPPLAPALGLRLMAGVTV
jgi:hypothetical protein